MSPLLVTVQLSSAPRTGHTVWQGTSAFAGAAKFLQKKNTLKQFFHYHNTHLLWLRTVPVKMCTQLGINVLGTGRSLASWISYHWNAKCFLKYGYINTQATANKGFSTNHTIYRRILTFPNCCILSCFECIGERFLSRPRLQPSQDTSLTTSAVTKLLNSWCNLCLPHPKSPIPIGNGKERLSNLSYRTGD